MLPKSGTCLNSSQCRFCGTALEHSFCDLGMAPLSNAFIKREQLSQLEPFYPLHAYVCECCYLVQLQEFQSPEEIFQDYAYFSSTSDSWLRHAKRYTEEMIKRFGLGLKHQVVEIASNDGYLLQYFQKKRVPVLGIEPAENVAAVAKARGIPTRVTFFGSRAAREIRQDGSGADLLVGNNVLAHVPDLNDFIQGLKIILKPGGVITMEFPHLLRLMEENQFDTIYHEHFSYLSLLTVEKIFSNHALVLFDVEELSSHGGSLRIYACHQDDRNKRISQTITRLRKKEKKNGLDQLETYFPFNEKVRETRKRLLAFFMMIKQQGKTISGYGAPAKGNTLLNYCGIDSEMLNYTVDRSSHKQGLFLPGTHIPIYPPEKIRETKPDYLLILPWNLKDEIMNQMAFIREWGGAFVVPIPEVTVL